MVVNGSNSLLNPGQRLGERDVVDWDGQDSENFRALGSFGILDILRFAFNSESFFQDIKRLGGGMTPGKLSNLIMPFGYQRAPQLFVTAWEQAAYGID
tara:strand:+ start:226 stop:519 length:294 start_codon:yes stop_codon:yes gene_type:complete